MIKQVLVGLDGCKDTETVVRYGSSLAKKHGARLLGLAVVDVADIEDRYHTPRPLGAGSADSQWYDDSIKEARELAESAIKTFEKVCSDEGVDHKSIIAEGKPSVEILAKGALSDVIILRDVTKFTCGLSEDEFCDATAEVLDHSTRPLILLPEEYREIKNVMIALDFQRLADKLLFNYVHLNPYPDAKVHIVHASNKSDVEVPQELVDFFELHKIDVTTSILAGDHTGQALVNYAKTEKVDMAVMGIHTMSKVWKVLLGSTGRYVIDKLDIPVFTMT